TIG
ncbi:hypothetical protein OY671_005606, partial [Metschnikowia pulcherrima]